MYFTNFLVFHMGFNFFLVFILSDFSQYIPKEDVFNNYNSVLKKRNACAFPISLHDHHHISAAASELTSSWCSTTTTTSKLVVVKVSTRTNQQTDVFSKDILRYVKSCTKSFRVRNKAFEVRTITFETI